MLDFVIFFFEFDYEYMIIYIVEEKIIEIEQYVEYFGYRCSIYRLPFNFQCCISYLEYVKAANIVFTSRFALNVI